MHQDTTWYGGRLQPRGLWVRWGPSPPPKREAEAGADSRQFSAHGYCGRTAGWINKALGMEVGLGSVHIVLDGDTAPLPKTGGRAPQFSAHLYCGKMAGWMKTPLGKEVDLGPGHIVLDGVPAPAKGAQQPLPLFGPCLLWPRSPISATAELLYFDILLVKWTLMAKNKRCTALQRAS